MIGIEPAARAAIEMLQHEYVDALDSKDMGRWLDCFSLRDEASYVCTPRENVERGLPISLMLDDCHDRLKDRVKFVTQIWKGSFEDYQTRHMIFPLSILPIGNSQYALRTNFCVISTEEANGISTVLVAGIYEDIAMIEDEKALFLSRKAILDTNIQPRYLVYPV